MKTLNELRRPYGIVGSSSLDWVKVHTVDETIVSITDAELADACGSGYLCSIEKAKEMLRRSGNWPGRKPDWPIEDAECDFYVNAIFCVLDDAPAVKEAAMRAYLRVSVSTNQQERAL